MSTYSFKPPSVVFAATATVLLFFDAWAHQLPPGQASTPTATLTPSPSATATRTASTTLTPSTTATATPTVTPNLTATATLSETLALNWQQVNAGTRAQLGSVSCPTVKLCLAAGGNTTLLKSTDGGLTWTPKQVDAQSAYIPEVECSSELNCLAILSNPVADTGGIFETKDAGETWTKTSDLSLVSGEMVRFSCPTSETCYGISEQQTLKKSGTTDWSVANAKVFAPPPPPLYLVDLACPSTDFCLAIGANRVDNEGVILKITNGGADVARVTNLTPELQKSSFEAITCQDAKTCFVVGRFGVIAKTDDSGATWQRLAWTPPKTDEPIALEDLTCPNALVCYVVGGNIFTGHCCGIIIKTMDGGKTWTDERLDLPVKLLAVTCTSETACVAVGDIGLIVRLTAAPLAGTPTATSTPPVGTVLANVVLAAGVKGLTVPYGVSETFPPDVRELYIIVTTYQAPASTSIKLVWSAVDAGNTVSPNTKMAEFSGTVQGTGSTDYYFRPGGTLAEGTYKVEVYLIDKLERTLNFRVSESATLPPPSPTISPVGSCPLVPPPASQSAVVQRIALAKGFDSSTGEPEDPTSTFKPRDTIHAVVHVVDAPEDTTLTATWYATDVGDAAPCNFRFPNSNTTPAFSGTTSWDFRFSRGAGFPVGLYRIELYVNDKFAMAADFSVQP